MCCIITAFQYDTVLILPNIEDFVTSQRVRICIGSRVAVVPDPCKDLVRDARLITEVV